MRAMRRKGQDALPFTGDPGGQTVKIRTMRLYALEASIVVSRLLYDCANAERICEKARETMYEMSREYLSCHVAGFGHWYGALVTNKLRPGKKLVLKGEPDNPYDPNAVSVWCGSTKIGFVPRSRNAELAKLLFFGYGRLFEARVQSVDWTQHPEAQLRMTIFLKDGR